MAGKRERVVTSRANRTANDCIIQISPAERQYYRDVFGFDPITNVIPLNEWYLVYRFEAWYPLSQDPALNASGVEIGARVDEDREGLVHNHIVFRYEGKEAIVECTHTVVFTGPAKMALGLAEDAHIGRRETSQVVTLPSWGHFAALKSYVAGISEVGLTQLLRYSLDSEHTEESTFGFNTIMRRQILQALNTVAPEPTLALSCDFFMELIDQAPADWILARVELLSTLIPLVEGLNYIQTHAPQDWLQGNREKLDPFRRLSLLLRLFWKKVKPNDRLALLGEVPSRTLIEGASFTTLELLEYLVGEGLGKQPVIIRVCGPEKKEYEFWAEVAVGKTGWYAEDEDDPDLVVQPWFGDDDGFFYSFGQRVKEPRTILSQTLAKPFRVLIFMRHEKPVFPEQSAACTVVIQDLNHFFERFEMVQWMLISH